MSKDFSDINSKNTPEWQRVRQLPFFQMQPFETIHPFFRLLAWYSAYFHAEDITNAEQVKNVTLHNNIFNLREEVFKPSLHPQNKKRVSPLTVPESVRQEFLETVKNLDDDYIYENPFEKNSTVMDYAVREWDGERFFYFLRAVRGNEVDKPWATLYKSLTYLWNIFPFCDFRIELAYQAYKYLKDPQPDANEPPYVCDLDPDSIRWASERKISENIALRHLLEESLKIEAMRKRNSITRLSHIFSFPRKHDVNQSFWSTPQNFVRLIVRHQELLKADANDKGYYHKELGHLRQLPEAYRKTPYGLLKNDDPKEQTLIDDHETLSRQFFFGNLYMKAYRATRRKVLGFDLHHPLYNVHDSFDREDLINALEASLGQEFYAGGDINFDKGEWSNRNYYLSEDQETIIARLALQEEGKEKTDIPSLVLRHQQPYVNYETDFDIVIEKNILDPRANALYRIFKSGNSFEEKLRAVAIPIITQWHLAFEKMGRLIEWLQGTTGLMDEYDERKYENKNSVALLYLAAEIKNHLTGFTGKECCAIAKTISDHIDDLDALQCPELLLIATFSDPLFLKTHTLGSLGEFPYQKHEKDIKRYKFGPKRIEKRDEFIAVFPSLLANYGYIKSGQWGTDLKQEYQNYQNQEAGTAIPRSKPIIYCPDYRP